MTILERATKLTHLRDWIVSATEPATRQDGSPLRNGDFWDAGTKVYRRFGGVWTLMFEAEGLLQGSIGLTLSRSLALTSQAAGTNQARRVGSIGLSLSRSLALTTQAAGTVVAPSTPGTIALTLARSLSLTTGGAGTVTPAAGGGFPDVDMLTTQVFIAEALVPDDVDMLTTQAFVAEALVPDDVDMLTTQVEVI